MTPRERQGGVKIVEAAVAQFPMVRHAQEVGWSPLKPSVATSKRGGRDGTFFRDELEAAVRRFNPWLTPDSVRSIVEGLEATPPTIEGNRQMLTWMRGERQWYDDTEERQRFVRLIDFDAPNANVLHVTWEWSIKPPARRRGARADMMFVVNGLPVALVEHKNPKQADAIERGLNQLKRYEARAPELMGSAQLFNVTHMLDYWYGVTWNLSRRFMARWKEPPIGRPAQPGLDDSYRFAVQSFFEPTDFLRTLRDWILFYVEDGETRKTVLRQHQRRAATRVVERCAEPKNQRGLVWHTQGSGKTFTLLTAARLLLQDRQRFQASTVIVVVDRVDLEGQLRGWVERLLGEMQQQDIPVHQADSKAELAELLRTDKRGLIVSMIHKFEGLDKNANTRDNVFVFIDEAHRSVARDLGTYLMGAVPNATIVGFTGTPIAKTEHGQGTFKIFGADDEKGYLDKYTIAESIEDETTLPIRHVMAPSETTVPAQQLDDEFFALAAAEGVTDVDELNKALDRAVGLRAFLTADDRVDKVAAYVARHFRENVAPLGYKAFLVGVNREACAKYKHALDKLLPAEWTAPVYTENADDVVKRPIVAGLQLSRDEEDEARLMFKKAGENPRILIVTDKLLTGFDAPLLYCMYLDKPMRDHVLLQAIARVNRPHVDPASGVRKRIGLVVDFVGVLQALEKALRFDSTDVSGVVEGIDVLLREFRDKLARAEAKYLSTAGEGGPDAWLEERVYEQLRDPAVRNEFFEFYKEIEALMEILSPSEELRDHLESYKLLAGLYASTRAAYARKVDYMADLAAKTRAMIQRSAVTEGLGHAPRTVTFDLKTVEALRGGSQSDAAKVFNLLRGMRKEIDDKPELAAVLLPLWERAERVQQDLEKRRTSSMEAMDLLSALAKEKDDALAAAEESGLSAKAFGVYWDLRNESALATGGTSAKDLARLVDELLVRFPNARRSVQENRLLRGHLYAPLLKLTVGHRKRLVDRVMDLALGTSDDDD